MHFNRFSLSSKEYEGKSIAGEDPAQIELNLFRENIGAVKVSQPNLKGQVGVHSAIELLKATRNPQKSGESKADYSGRIIASGVEALEITEGVRSGGKEMIIKRLVLKNIRSYKSTDINFPLGKTLFEGDIGSGKSTILMAIEFGLFGLGSEKAGSLLRAGENRRFRERRIRVWRQGL